MIRASLIALSFSAAFAAPAFASGLQAEQSVHKIVETADADGATVISLVPADRVAPGDKIAYTLSYSNDGDEPAGNVILTMPVPDEVRYVEKSASRDGLIVGFSVDGGETFASRGDLAVTVDGEPRQALAEDITHIRWTFEEPIPVGSVGSVSFRAVLR